MTYRAEKIFVNLSYKGLVSRICENLTQVIIKITQCLGNKYIFIEDMN